jgi:pSer/pThr/pTyr-binding forkhead associated (FHA) protein
MSEVGLFHFRQSRSEPTVMAEPQRTTFQSHMNSLTLTIASGPVAGQTRRVDPGHKPMIGRGESSDFAVIDLRMSREHFQVLSRSGDWHVRDCQSSNGTMVNGQRVDEITLREGDIIEAGDTKFRVTFTDGELHVDDFSAVPRPARPKEAQTNRNSLPSRWLWLARILVFSRRWPLALAAENLIKSSDGQVFWDAS